MMNKCLVYHPYPRDLRGGGPSGFISQNFQKFASDVFHVTPNLEKLPRNFIPDFISAISHGVPLHKCIPLHKFALRSTADIRRRQKFFRSRASAYRLLWFHDCGTFYEVYDLIKENQSVVYQPHTPVLPWDEADNPAEMRRIEIAARALFKRANILVLPNEHCSEIFGHLLDSKKVIFIRSACSQPPKIVDIPLDRNFIYFLFIGRRIPVKGFDLIVNAFKIAYSKRKEIRLLLCGRGDLEVSDGIIDLGPQIRIHDWIAATDCVVNANRQSYFDLSVMETLSIGKPLFYTPTGGHRELMDFNSAGLNPVECTVESFAQIFLSFSPQTDLNELQRAQRSIFDQNYSSEAYQARLQDNWAAFCRI